MLCSLNDALTSMHLTLQPTARITFELITVGGMVTNDSIEYWMASNTYYQQLWMTQCAIEVLS